MTTRLVLAVSWLCMGLMLWGSVVIPFSLPIHAFWLRAVAGSVLVLVALLYFGPALLSDSEMQRRLVMPAIYNHAAETAVACAVLAFAYAVGLGRVDGGLWGLLGALATAVGCMLRERTLRKKTAPAV